MSRRVVDSLVAGWLILWGLLGCTALVLIGLRNGFLYAHFDMVEGTMCVLGGLGAPCLWAGVLFFRRNAFSPMGLLVVFANVVMCGFSAIAVIQIIRAYSPSSFDFFKHGIWFAPALLHLTSLVCMGMSQRRLEQQEAA